MENIFLGFLNRSITAGWLILAVIALRMLLRRAPKWIHCLLWSLVAFRLVCPFSLESVFSLVPRFGACGRLCRLFYQDRKTLSRRLLGKIL